MCNHIARAYHLYRNNKSVLHISWTWSELCPSETTPSVLHLYFFNMSSGVVTIPLWGAFSTMWTLILWGTTLQLIISDFGHFKGETFYPISRLRTRQGEEFCLIPWPFQGREETPWMRKLKAKKILQLLISITWKLCSNIDSFFYMFS